MRTDQLNSNRKRNFQFPKNGTVKAKSLTKEIPQHLNIVCSLNYWQNSLEEKRKTFNFHTKLVKSELNYEKVHAYNFLKLRDERELYLRNDV